MTTPTTRALHDQLHTTLSQAESVIVMAHVGPDGDTLGAMLAMASTVEQHYPNATTVHRVVAGPVPDVYTLLPGHTQIINSQQPNSLLLPRYDVAIALDCGSPERLDASRPWFDSAATSVNIDHHISNAHYGTLNLVEADAAATGEVVARWLAACALPLTQDIAICLYVTLLTDTGGFRFPATSPAVMRLAAQLIEAGANPSQLYKALYEGLPLAKSRLQADRLLHSNHNATGTLLWTDVTQAQLQAFHAKEEYLEGLIDQLRIVQHVTLAALFKETTTGGTKVSLRSNTPRINVASLLETYGGGGHTAAAGALLDLSLEEAKAQLLPLLEQVLDDDALSQPQPAPVAPVAGSIEVTVPAATPA